MTVRVGLVDSGVDEESNTVVAQKSFRVDGHGNMVTADNRCDLTGHGTQMARLIRSSTTAPDLAIELFSAQVFSSEGASSPSAVAAGIDWLVSSGIHVACMSFGLHADRTVLRQACQRAFDAGVILVAAAPARGDPVYPAAYKTVIAVTGDARCAPGEFSRLGTGRAEFGACVYLAGGRAGEPGSSGASLAAAHAVREVARFLSTRTHAQIPDVVRHLTTRCRFHGAERRTL